MTLKELLFLPGNARFADFGLLLLRIATGVFLIYRATTTSQAPQGWTNS